MIQQCSEFISFNGELTKDRYEDLVIYGCDKIARDLFLYKVEQENTNNKAKLRELLGGKKLYTYVKEIRGSINWDKIKEILYNELYHSNEDGYYNVITRPLGTRNWKNENRRMKTFADEIERMITIMVCSEEWKCSNDKEILDVIKLEYWYNEDIQKIRDLPKLTRLFRTIYDGALKRLQIENKYEPMVAKIMDELGRKPKSYILELSTDYIDILTCSVSDNFTSCFNIKKGSCNMSSTNYLAIDNSTAILKLYECTEENLKLMDKGTMDWNKAIARAFVSFDAENNQRVVIGRLYPDNKILDYESLKTIILPLLKCENAESGQWVKDMLVNYGSNYTGYKDYVESWNVGFLGKTNSKRISVGANGCVFYNPFKNKFQVSEDWKIDSGTMWTLYDMDRYRLESVEAISPFDEDKEESESSIVDTTNNITMMIDRRFIDDTPFYTIPDVQTISINGISTTTFSVGDYINSEYVNELTAEPSRDN